MNLPSSLEVNTEGSQNAAISSFSMANMAYMALPLGTIRIGHTIDMPGGETLPVGSDEFRVTKPLRSMDDGQWIADDMDATLRAALDNSNPARPGKLRVIPIKFISNEPALAVRSRYEAFSASGQSVCSSSGDGRARRVTGQGGRAEVQCVGCDTCEFAQAAGNSCQLFGRISVQIEGQTSALGTYVLRTGSINTLRSFESNLRSFHALFGGRLRGIPFAMKLRTMSTMQSAWKPFFVVDLELNGVDLVAASKAAAEQHAKDQESSLDFAKLAEMQLAGLSNGGSFEDSVGNDAVDLGEFYPASNYALTHSVLGAVKAGTSAEKAISQQPVTPAQPMAERTVSLGSVGIATRKRVDHDAPGGAVKLQGALVSDFDFPDLGPSGSSGIKIAPRGGLDVTGITSL